MSKEKPESPFTGIFAPTTKVIHYKITDSSGRTHRVREVLDISINGNTGGTISVSGRLEDGSAFRNIKPGEVLVLRDGTEVDIIELAQNSSEREEAWHTEINRIRGKIANDTDKSEAFEQALVDNGVFDAAAGGGSINDIAINPKNTNKNNDNESGESETKEVTPQQIFSNPMFNDEQLKYPIDMMVGNADGEFGGSQDYMYIEQFSYAPPQPGGDEGVDTTIAGNITEGLERRSNIGRRTIVGQETYKDRYGVEQFKTSSTEERFGSCFLPIPNRLDVSNGVNWGEGRANALEMGAFSAATGQLSNMLREGKGLSDLIGNTAEQASKTFTALKEDLQNQKAGGATSANILNAVIARSVLSRIGINVDVDQFITRQTGAAINPNLELLFGGPRLRSFSFNFDFAPNSAQEAIMVRKIQRWFRQGMLPHKRNANASRTLFLSSPNIFRLCYMNNSRRIKGLNTFKICALTACQVSFAPDGVYQSYEDKNAFSMPVRSTMGLTFNELTPIFANDYNPDLTAMDPSITDLGTNISGGNSITDDDLGF